MPSHLGNRSTNMFFQQFERIIFGFFQSLNPLAERGEINSKSHLSHDWSASLWRTCAKKVSKFIAKQKKLILRIPRPKKAIFSVFSIYLGQSEILGNLSFFFLSSFFINFLYSAMSFFCCCCCRLLLYFAIAFFIPPWVFLFCREFSLFCRGFLYFAVSFLYFLVSILYFTVTLFMLPWLSLYCCGFVFLSVTIMGHRRNQPK